MQAGGVWYWIWAVCYVLCLDLDAKDPVRVRWVVILVADT